MISSRGNFELDLRHVERGKRAATWLEWHEALYFDRVVPSDIPGGDLVGHLRGTRLASASVCRIASAFRHLRVQPDTEAPDSRGMYTIVLQLRGNTKVNLDDGVISLTPSDVTFLYGRQIEYETPVGAEVLLLHAPASLVLSRQPSAAALVGRYLPAHDPAAGILRSALISAYDASATLTPPQQNSLLLSLIELLGVPRFDAELDHQGRDERRVHQALREIEFGLTEAGFDANCVADSIHISRRRLDEIFVRVLGKPVAPCIWERRLQRACEALRDSAQQHRSVTDIALSHGFEDVAHFARAFKKRFGVTALKWRAGEKPISSITQ